MKETFRKQAYDIKICQNMETRSISKNESENFSHLWVLTGFGRSQRKV